MSERILEVEADTLEETREQVRLLVSEGLHVVSERVISDGKPQTVKASASTTEAAFAEVQRKIPSDATILEQKESAPTHSEQKIITVKADDEEHARREAKSEAYQQFGFNFSSSGTAVVKVIRLVVPGKRGFLGMGSTRNQYEVEVSGSQSAIVEVTYKTKARISVTLSDKTEQISKIVLAAGFAGGRPDELPLRVRILISQLKREKIDVPIKPDELGMGLGSSETRRAVQRLSEEAERREAIVGQLVKIGAPAVELLIKALEDSDPDVCKGAAEALGKIKHPKAIEPLIKALTDSDSDMCQTAAEALGEIKHPQAIEPHILYKEIPEMQANTSSDETKKILAGLGSLLGLALLIWGLSFVYKGVFWSPRMSELLKSDWILIGGWISAIGLFLLSLGFGVILPRFGRGRTHVISALFFIVLTIFIQPWMVTRPGQEMGTLIAPGVVAVQRITAVGDLLKVTIPLLAVVYGYFARRDKSLGQIWRLGANLGFFGGIVGTALLPLALIVYWMRPS